MSSEENFLENDVNATGFSVHISFAEKDDSINISLKQRKKTGSDLETFSMENASHEQVAAICDILNIT